MSLTAGSKLGPYEILSPAGAGGMGEVYRARDTRLGRDVAIKVLPAHLSSNPDLKQRFEREARAISSLQHPHICTLYDIGHDAGTDFLVLEFLEGETLAKRLERGPLALNELIKVGIEIADALDKAHRHGIIHRDLKPGNIMLTKAGAKLMDFGLAKPGGGVLAASARAGHLTPSSPTSPVISATKPPSPLTADGAIVGTFQYMSPEQIQGDEADARSDIFSFGAVLYEMATARRAFEGKSQLSVASAILEKDPEPISKTQPLTPPALEHVVSTCLAKDPDERFQTAHDVRIELRWAGESSRALALRAAPLWQRLLPIAVAILAVLALAGVLFLRRAPVAETSSFRFEIPLPAQGAPGTIAVSPSGQQIAFSALGNDNLSHVFVRRLDSFQTTVVPGTERAGQLAWSPDEKSLVYFAVGKMKIVDLASGSSQTLADASGQIGIAWAPDGSIIFPTEYGLPLRKVSASGGAATDLTRIDHDKRESAHLWPKLLPDGRHILYLSRTTPGEIAKIYVAGLDGGVPRLVRDAEALVGVAEPGRLLFVRGGTLYEQDFDLRSFAVSGEPRALVQSVFYDSNNAEVTAATSFNGVLAFQGSSIGRELVIVGRDGKRLGSYLEPRVIEDFDVSPDGKRIAIVSRVTPSDAFDLFLYDIARNLLSRLTTNSSNDNSVSWSPRGDLLYFSSDRGNGMYDIYSKAPALGSAEDLIFSSREDKTVLSFSPAGELIFSRNEAPINLWTIDPKPGAQPKLLLKGERDRRFARVSPDGKWLAFSSADSGRSEIYVSPLSDLRQAWQVSTSGSTMVRWSLDGKELFYVSLDGKWMAVSFKPGPTPDLGSPHLLFQLEPFDQQVVVLPGGRFLIARAAASQRFIPISVITNWPNAKK